MKRFCAVLLVLMTPVLSEAVPDRPRADPQDRWLEWCATAPEVVVAKILGKEGRSIIAVTEKTLKGGRHPGEEFRIDLRKANRERMSHEAVLRLLHGESYLLLLEPAEQGKKKLPVYYLVRGVQGARRLPAEGAEGVLGALRAFIDLHRIEDYDRLWKRQAALLESTNPLVLQEILAQFIKFRRGGPAVAPAVLPLTAHPNPRIRAEAVTLLGQILEDTGGRLAMENPEVADELIAMAKGDPSGSCPCGRHRGPCPGFRANGHGWC